MDTPKVLADIISVPLSVRFCNNSGMPYSLLSSPALAFPNLLLTADYTYKINTYMTHIVFLVASRPQKSTSLAWWSFCHTEIRFSHQVLISYCIGIEALTCPTSSI